MGPSAASLLLLVLFEGWVCLKAFSGWCSGLSLQRPFLRVLLQVVAASDRLLVVVDQRGQVLRRAWVLWEILAAITLDRWGPWTRPAIFVISVSSQHAERVSGVGRESNASWPYRAWRVCMHAAYRAAQGPHANPALPPCTAPCTAHTPHVVTNP